MLSNFNVASPYLRLSFQINMFKCVVIDLDMIKCSIFFNIISLCRVVLGDVVKKGWEKSSNYFGKWFESRNGIITIYGEALQSSSPQLVQLIQVNAKFSFLLVWFFH